jgi:hypothetical protein
MTTEAQIGYGRLLQIRNDNASPSPEWVTTGELTQVNGPSFAADAVEATHMESPSRFREFVEGLRDAGELSGELNYVPASVGMGLLVAQLGRTAHYRIVEPGGESPAKVVESDGILTGFEVQAPVADKMVAAITLKLSGVPVMTGVTFA